MFRLTQFEKAKIIGTRATQLARGAPPQVDITGLTDAYSIAEKEFRESKIPFVIQRNYPKKKVVEINPNTRREVPT